MKKFRFKLKALEKLRGLKEKEALRVLAEAQRLREVEMRKKNKILDQIHNGLSRRELLGLETTTPVHFQIEEEFIVGNKYRLLFADQAIFRAQKKINKAMGLYIKAKKDLKIIEKLKERELYRHNEEVRIKENREMDDLNIMRARFKKEVA